MECCWNVFQSTKVDHDVDKIKVWKNPIHTFCSRRDTDALTLYIMEPMCMSLPAIILAYCSEGEGTSTLITA